MTRQQITLSIVVGMLVLIIGWQIVGRKPDSNVDHPDGYQYICENPSCKNEFSLSTREFNDYVGNHPGQMIKCPKCGTDAKPKGTIRTAPPLPGAKTR